MLPTLPILQQSQNRITLFWYYSGVSFVSRKYSRIRVYEARPGPYFIMVEPLQDIRNVTIEINVFAEEKYVERTRSQSWRTYSIPWPIKGSISFLNSRAFIQSCEPRVFLFPCTKPVVTNLKHLSICEINAIHIDLLNSFFS